MERDLSEVAKAYNGTFALATTCTQGRLFRTATLATAADDASLKFTNVYFGYIVMHVSGKNVCQALFHAAY